MTDEITAATPKEIYTFKYTPEDISTIYTGSKKTYTIPLFIILAVAALLLWAYGTEAVAITCAIFILVFPGIPYLKSFIKFKKSWSATYEKLLASVYDYEVYDTYFCISVTRNGELIRTSRIYFSEIDKLQTIGKHLHIIHSNQLFLLRRSDLPETSVFYKLMNSPKTTPAAAPKGLKPTAKSRIKTVSWLLFIGSIAAFFIAVALLPDDLAVKTILLYFAPAILPLASLIFGIVITVKGLKGVKNIIAGAVVLIIMALIFLAFSYLPQLILNNFDNHAFDAPAISRTEQLLGIDLSDSTSISSFEQEGEVSCTAPHYFCYLDLGDESSEILREQMSDSTRWATYFELSEIAPSQNKYIFTSTVLIYNTDTGEYNTLPAENGTYHFISLVYSPDTGSLSISEYDVDYVK